MLIHGKDILLCSENSSSPDDKLVEFRIQPESFQDIRLRLVAESVRLQKNHIQNLFPQNGRIQKAQNTEYHHPDCKKKKQKIFAQKGK